MFWRSWHFMASFYLDNNTAFYCISQVYHVAVNPTNSGAVQLDSTNIDATLGKKRYFACKLILVLSRCKS